MSYRTFCSADPNFDSDWSSPLLMQDRHNFQVEYSTSENQPNIIGLQNYVDKLMQEGNPEPSSEEVEAAFREENTDWSDEATNAI